MEKPYIVGITGGSASGKTYFLKSLLNAFSREKLCLVSQDNYYKAREFQPLDEKGISNFDLPDSIDSTSFANDIKDLIQGKKVERQEYTFNNPAVVPEMLVLNPAPVIVVEGIFAFYFPEVRELLDLKVFIEADEHIRLSRRILRDHEERGYGLDDVLYRYEKHVAPTYNKYIKPFRSEANLIIPNNTSCNTALEVLIAYLKSKLEIRN